ncbi:hypothetical protein [Nodosilinea nodulosa]|uniref:hypothetical protein n=1 Tax=Nodosilinea nodulosa TaxID=416001 RepID=UPI0003168A62|nr:hypothetical protein [Nodosilinea nodulosa]
MQISAQQPGTLLLAEAGTIQTCHLGQTDVDQFDRCIQQLSLQSCSSRFLELV